MTGHLSEVELEALAHNRVDLVHEARRQHLNDCLQCQDRLTDCFQESEALLLALDTFGTLHDDEVQQLVTQAMSQPSQPVKVQHWIASLGLFAFASLASLWNRGIPQGSASQVADWLRGAWLLARSATTVLFLVPGGMATATCLGLATLLAFALLFKRYWQVPALTATTLLVPLLTSSPAYACTLTGDWPALPPLVTLSARQVPLSTALYRVAEAANLGISVQLDSDPLVGLQVTDRPLPLVLQSLLDSSRYTCRFESDMVTVRPLASAARTRGGTAEAKATALDRPPQPQPGERPHPLAHAATHEPQLDLDKLKHVGTVTNMGDAVLVAADQWADEVITMGDNTRIDGYVDGDVFTAGGDVLVTGHVTGDVVSMGGNITVSGQIDGDAASMGGDIDLRQGAQLGGEAISMGGEVHDAGVARHPAGGRKRKWSAQHHDEESVVEKGLSLLVRALAVFLFGLLLNTLWPARLRAVQHVLITRPGISLLIGLGVVFVLPILAIALCITLIGIPAALLLIAAALTAVFVAQAATATVVGAALPLHQIHGRPLRELAAGTAVLLLLWLMPYLGTLVTIATVLLGYGALMQTRFRASPKALS